MAASSATKEVTIGTLRSNPSVFFDKMESVMDEQLHQHTASIMSMPSNFLRNGLQEVVRERDEEDVMKHLTVPEDREDDEESFDTDDDWSGDEQEESQVAPKSTLKDLADSADDEADDEVGGSTVIEQISSNASNGKMEAVDAKELEEDDGTPSYLKSMDTMDTDDFHDIHSRDRSGGVDEEVITAVVHRPSVRRGHLASTLLTAEEHSHSDHSHSDYSHDDHEEHKDESPESSRTMESERELWRSEYVEGAFPECNIRFEEDDWSDGKKPPAVEFVSLRFFYQFVYDQVHCYSQFLLDTSLPVYAEWKKMRRVTLRPKSLQTVDYALKECLKCSQSIKALVRNTIILCFDTNQPVHEQQFKDCDFPSIRATEFNVGSHSIMAAWDLFDQGSTPSANDWVRALSLDEGVAQTLSSCLPDLSHLAEPRRNEWLAYHRGKTYKYLMISEFFNLNDHFLKFGAGPIHWRIIKKRFLQKHGKEYSNDILSAFDKLSYFVNPPLAKLNEWFNGNGAKVSLRRIIAEPIMWLFYMVSYLIERQEKLTQLYVAAMKYSADNSGNQRVHKCVSDLAKQAKDESERLRAVMTRLPGTEDLKQTLIDLVKKRDPKGEHHYTKSLKQYKF